jgi:hypothetical protein
MDTGDIRTGIPLVPGFARLSSAEPSPGDERPSRVQAVARKVLGSTPRVVTIMEPFATLAGLRNTVVADVTCSSFARSFDIESGRARSSYRTRMSEPTL